MKTNYGFYLEGEIKTKAFVSIEAGTVDEAEKILLKMKPEEIKWKADTQILNDGFYTRVSVPKLFRYIIRWTIKPFEALQSYASIKSYEVREYKEREQDANDTRNCKTQ